jgi:group I intron endonuclease
MKKTIFANSFNTIFVTLGNVNPKIIYKKYSKKYNVSAIICYNNADSDKKKVVGENKGKSGIYRLTNLENGKFYVGSSVDLGCRFTTYYYFLYLSVRSKSSLICRALLKYGYSKFKVEILEYCEKENLLVREQYYLDLLKPEYNILKTAGSSIGFKHSEETLTKFRARKHTEETLEKFKTRVLSAEARAKISAIKGSKVVVSDLLTGEINEYNSIHMAAKGLGAPYSTVRYYLKNKKIYQDRYEITTKE